MNSIYIRSIGGLKEGSLFKHKIVSFKLETLLIIRETNVLMGIEDEC